MKHFIVLFVAVTVAGCGGGKEASRESSTGSLQDDLRKYEADFHPSDHDSLGGPGGAVSTPATNALEKASPQEAASVSESDLVPGFRVQIFSSNDIDAAKAKKEEAEADFPSEYLYLQYDPPAYKLRVGNFLQRYEADRFAKLAVEKGFPDSWVVPEKVFKQPPH
ncbi:MAG TPA: SPOR domain-containing protein [Bacteroidota bacterium]|nr:SPOR domain-containing protein [Bacteroidota bacterium]